MKVKAALLASGRGTNFQALMEATRADQLSVEWVALVCDRPNAPVIEKAKLSGIEVKMVLQESRIHQDEKILEALRPYQPQFLVMAGYTRIVTAKLLEAFRSPRGYTRVTNIHPSLLPAFPGLHSYEKAYDYGAKWAGVTVHCVEEQVDSGPILAQEVFDISKCESASEVEKLGLAVEHRLYSQTLKWFFEEKFELSHRGGEGPKRRICVRPN